MRNKFDKIEISSALKPASDKPINLILDATFFGCEYGYLCFHDTRQIIYFEEIKTESVAVLRSCINTLAKSGYCFQSFTLDGKRGFIQELNRMFPATPVQMCHFHQKAIIRRYITNNPKSLCGKDLQKLMRRLSTDNPQQFKDSFFALQEKHHVFLAERNDAGKFMHKRMRSAFRSIRTNMPLLFAYKIFPDDHIPHTTNQLEGTFAHLKEKILIHRGLSKNRKKNAIKFILNNT